MNLLSVVPGKTNIANFFDSVQFSGVSQWRYDLCAED